MNKQTLSELFIIEDYLPEESHVKNSELNRYLWSNCDNTFDNSSNCTSRSL